MATFLYAPGVRILVATAKHGTIDVSDDISSGTVSLRTNQMHSCSFALVNHRRKYDGVFTPNDRFSVRLKRIKWLQIMSGYLSEVPFFTTYPMSVKLRGECTIKRIYYRLWDQGAAATAEFINQYTNTDTASGRVLDDSFTLKARAVLRYVAQWPDGAIHIGRIPSAWVERVDNLARELEPTFSVAAALIGTESTMVGVNPVTDSGTTTLKKKVKIDSIESTEVDDVGPGYGQLPYLNGKVNQSASRPGTAYLTGESRAHPMDGWWCEIQLPFLSHGESGHRDPDGNSPSWAGLSTAEVKTAKAWWTNRRLILVNVKTNASIVVRVMGDGPPIETQRQVEIGQAALDALGAKAGDEVAIRFALPEAKIGTDGVVLNANDSSSTTTPPPADHPEAFAPSTSKNSSGTVVAGSKEGLKPNVAAAFDFGAANFPGVTSIGGVGSRPNKSDHPAGLALDFMVSTGIATGQEQANGNAIAAWFAGNPIAFGVKYIIWYGRVNHGTGWKPYTHPNGGTDPTSLHMNHVHVSFNDTGLPSMQAMGSPWPGSAAGDFEGGFTAVSGGSLSPIGADYWFSTHDPESAILWGIRALMNDQPLQPFITTLMQTAMRSYCSAPNGDFIGWFPDFFGVYGTAGRMMIRNIELQDFSMVWSDDNLKTHVFTSGSMTGYGSPAMETQVAALKAQTYGVATVEFPALLQALLNVDPGNPDAGGWLNPKAILDRFGARVMYEPMGVITSRKAEFWYALQLFQENWANQFTAQAPISFMPELFPGMLMCLADYGIQFYVNGVDHTFDFQGGGFSTTAYIQAPSAMDGRGLFGLPKGGRI